MHKIFIAMQLQPNESGRKMSIYKIRQKLKKVRLKLGVRCPNQQSPIEVSRLGLNALPKKVTQFF